MLKTKDLFEDFRKIARIRSPKKLYFYAIIVGFFAGLGALGFMYLLQFASEFTQNLSGLNFGQAAGESSKHYLFNDNHYNHWIFFLLPIVGMIGAGLLAHFFDSSVTGNGTDSAIQNFHDNEAIVKKRSLWIKSFATISTLAGGGSVGKEGPIAQIGSSIGSLIGQFIDIGPKARRSLFIAGMAGGLGAIFMAPLGGALTAVEVLYKEDFESESIIPAILASVTGYFVFTSIHGFHHVFNLPVFHFTNWNELYFYAILGVLCFILGFLFVKITQKTQALYEKIKYPIYVKAGIGGLLIAIIGLFSWEVLGSGFGFLQQLMKTENISTHSYLFQLLSNSSGQLDFVYLILFLFVIILLKIITTSFTVNLGGSGGIFGPSLVIGGIIGGLVGITAHHFYPQIAVSHIPYIVVGMGGFFAGVANAPIAAVIMVSELTGGYELLLPLMTVSILSLIFSHSFSIYRGQRLNKFESPAHKWDMTNDFLKDIHIIDMPGAVQNYNKMMILEENVKVKNLYKISRRTKHTDFVIIDKNKKYKGILSLRHLHPTEDTNLEKSSQTCGEILSIKNEDTLEQENTDKTNINSIPPGLHPQDTLSHALQIVLNWDLNKVAVVDDDDFVLGFVTFRDILQAYRKEVLRYNKKT